MKSLRRIVVSLAAAAVLGGIVTTAQAVPYASCVKENGQNVSFILNENGASVKVILQNPDSELNLGTLNKGTQTFSKGTSTAYRIEVTKSTPVGWFPISDSNNVAANLYGPTGIAVVQNPTNLAMFGRVFINNSVPGTTTIGARPTDKGIYVLNPDLTDALGQGNSAKTAGITFYSSGTSSQTERAPFKVDVGQDNKLYISDFSTNTGNTATIYRTDLDVTSHEVVLEGIGTAANPTVHTSCNGSAIAKGSQEAGNLTVWAIDGQWAGSGNRNRLLRWDIGSATLPFNAAPAALGSAGNGSVSDVQSDLDIAPDGKFFLAQYRSIGFTSGFISLRTYDTDGTTLLWDSLTASTSLNVTNADFLNQIRAVKVSPDNKYVAVIRLDTQVILLPLTNGVPDISASRTNRVFGQVSASTTASRDVSWDAAGNLYAVNRSHEYTMVMSPGGTYTAITGSDGTFQLTQPATMVSVAVDTALQKEGSSTVSTFTVTRTGDTAAALTVNLSFTGTAANGVDYPTNLPTLTIDAGSATKTFTVQATDDLVAELTESLTVNITAGTNYGIGTPASASVTILDNETPELYLSTLYTNMFEGVADYCVFRVNRRGETNVAVTANVSYAGQATPGVDYQAVSNIVINPGIVTANFTNRVIADTLAEGDETIVCQIEAGTGYTIGTNPPVYGMVFDNDNGTETVLFADNFDTDSSGSWTTTYAAADMASDYYNTFGYEYSGLNLPPPSGSSTTAGLRMEVNKWDTIAAAAAVNVYPNGQSFSGDYAIRFSMFFKLGSGAGTTEFVTCGLNHSGTRTNWWRASTAPMSDAPADQDGVWAAMVSDASDGNYLFTAGANVTNGPAILTNRASIAAVFKPGVYPLSGAPAVTNMQAWTDVELSQVADIVTLKMNGVVVAQTTNSTAFKSGNIMLGYMDPYDSIGVDSFVIIDNFRVVRVVPPAPQPPVITTQPRTQTALQGTNVTFTVAATSSSPMTYQWYVGSSPIAWGTGSSLTLTNIQLANTGTYFVDVSNGAGTTTSSNAVLTVIVPPTPVITNAWQSGGANMTLNWPAGYGFKLQSATNVSGPWVDVTTTSPYSANVKASPKAFYRLTQ